MRNCYKTMAVELKIKTIDKASQIISHIIFSLTVETD